jgi:hypothetical protein
MKIVLNFKMIQLLREFGIESVGRVILMTIVAIKASWVVRTVIHRAFRPTPNKPSEW